MSKNIIWEKSDKALAITTILADDIDSKQHAKHLTDSGLVDPAWSAKLFDLDAKDIPSGNHDLLRIKGKKVVLLDSAE